MGVKERRVLLMLGRHGELSGLEIVKASGARIGRGSVYVFLARLEAMGYVTARVDATAQRRNGFPVRKYTITHDGVEAWRRAVDRRAA